MNFIKKWGLGAVLTAAMAFAWLALAPAHAGWNITQNDDGSTCWTNPEAVDGWCLSGGRNQLYIDTPDAVHQIPREVFSIFDDFLSQTIIEADGPWIENSGGDTQAVDPAIVATAVGGQITLASGDADGVCSNDCSQIVSSIPVTADLGGVVFETRLHIDGAITTVSVCAGLTDSTSLEEPASIATATITTVLSDGVVFCFDSAATLKQWYAIGVDTNTDATGNGAAGAASAPVADTFQVLRIELDADGVTARFYIDGVLVVRLTAAAATPTVNLFATVVVNSTTTTLKTVDIDYIYVGHTR